MDTMTILRAAERPPGLNREAMPGGLVYAFTFCHSRGWIRANSEQPGHFLLTDAGRAALAAGD